MCLFVQIVVTTNSSNLEEDNFRTKKCIISEWPSESKSPWQLKLKTIMKVSNKDTTSHENSSIRTANPKIAKVLNNAIYRLISWHTYEQPISTLPCMCTCCLRWKGSHCFASMLQPAFIQIPLFPLLLVLQKLNFNVMSICALRLLHVGCVDFLSTVLLQPCSSFSVSQFIPHGHSLISTNLTEVGSISCKGCSIQDLW